MAPAVDARGRGEQLAEREDESRPTLDDLLVADHWRRNVRNPELKKALGYIRATIGEIRRLLALPADERPLYTPEVEARLRDTLDQPVGKLKVDTAWELYNHLKEMLLFLGSADYGASLLDHEAERTKDESLWHPWTQHFKRDELERLRENYRSENPDPRLHAQAAQKLSFLYARRAEAGRERRAMLAQRTRYLSVATVLLLALLLVNVAVIGIRPSLREPTLLIALLIGIIAGLVIEMARIRDHLATLDDLSEFWARMRLAVVASAALCTGLVVAHGAADGLSEHSTSTELLLVGIAALAATCMAIVWSGFWRRWIFWRQEYPEDPGPSLLASAVAVAVLIEFFAIATVILVVYGAVDLPAENAPELASAEQYYAWHLADAIPALDVPETLNWERPLTSTDNFAGILLLGFKLLAILPIAGLIASLLERYRTGPKKTAASQGDAAS